MPTRVGLNEFIAAVESGDQAWGIVRCYSVDSGMKENGAAPRLGRDVLVAHERAVLARMSHVYSKAVSSVMENDRVAIHRQIRQGASDRRGRVAGMARRQDFSRTVLLRPIQTEGLSALRIDTSARLESSSRLDPLALHF
jgi:hypothetical protein